MIRTTFFKIFFGTILIFLMVSEIPLQAQSETFRHITPRDGLPSGFIWTMTQDSKGFIWIGTNTGLGKHDGYSTKVYRNNPQDRTTISGGEVYDIIEYDETTFFLATIGGLNLFNPATEISHRFSVPDSLPDPGSTRDLLLLDEHSLWIAASSGLFLVDPTTLKGANPTVEFFEIPGIEANQAPNLTALAADSENNLWVGSASSLYKFSLDAKSFVDIGLIDDDAARVLEGNIWSMLYSSGNDLIITSTTGLAILKDGDIGFEEVKQLGEYDTEELRSALFQSITEDREGKIWLGTGFMGAHRWDPETGDVVSYRTSSDSDNTIASDDVHYAFEDSEGNIWFGYHFEGASIMFSNSWNYEVHIPFPDLPSSDPRNSITYAYMDEEGKLWATTANGLIRDLGTENQEFFGFDISAYESLEENQSLSVIQYIHNNKVYMVSQGVQLRTGYIVFDPDKEGDPFTVLQIPNGLQIVPSLGTNLGDLFYGGVFDTNSIIRVDLNSDEIELIDLPVQGEYRDAFVTVSVPHFIYENELYTQVFFIGIPDGDKIESFILNLESGEIRTHELTVDYPIMGQGGPPLVSSYAPGVVYLNAATGLIRIDNLNSSYTVLFEDQMSLLREGSPLMTEDEEGYIWLNNLTGMTRVDPLTESIEYFEVPREEFSPTLGFTALLPTGEIIVPGNGSYIQFNPADLESTQPAGRTLISSLQAGTDVFELLYSNEKPEIESDQNTLTFNFIGLDLRNPASIHYRFRILGSENEQWTRVGTQKSVFIPNLAAGEYTFEVQSGSQFGTFEGQTASLDFSVLPPWWNTIPAYLMYLLLFGGLIFGVDRFQRRRLIQKERERAREKELQQAKEIEKAYENLKAAQEQLVQQEKLASLGQLTAGIAHEIKNPLNFVNNFSELSIELIEEAREEVKGQTAPRGRDWEKRAADGKGQKDGAAGRGDDAISENDKNHAPILDILDDIEANLRKIHEHGTRADGIVKSMLQHSRGGSGKMEPTDLNGLVKEYVNLSFHGMRASKNPINVDIEMNLDEEVGEVPLITEDFSRVIVNLCNNAFDAMRERQGVGQKAQGSGRYEPKLTIRTKSDNGRITIEVEDNGPGIPDEIRDKILQPFFTTKKGTEGTGLGLSITNDIIKVHGGTLNITTDNGEGTTFTIILPVQ